MLNLALGVRPFSASPSTGPGNIFTIVLLIVFLPTCQVRVVSFFDVMMSSFFSFFIFSFSSSKHHLPARDCRETRRTSSAAWLDCTCQFLIAVGLARLFQCDSVCASHRTFASRKSLWASPGFLRVENRRGHRRTFCVTKNVRWNARSNVRKRMPDRIQKECQKKMPDRMTNRMLDRMPDRLPDRMSEHMSDRMPAIMSDRNAR